MPELDEITQKILLQGDGEILEALNKIAETGKEAFESFAEAVEKGGIGTAEFAKGLDAIVVGVSAAAAALVEFTEAQDDLIQKSGYIADAFGVTLDKLQGLEAGFAAAGVSTQTFERFAQRLSTTIALQWPAIAESIRTASEQQDEAQERVVAATTRVAEAQMRLRNQVDDSSLAIASANLHVADTYQKMKDAAQDALAAAAHDTNSVASADLALEAAQQRLAKARGAPVSAAEKQDLELRQASLAVTEAQQAQLDAVRKKQENSEAATRKQQEAVLAYKTAVNNAAEAEEKADLAHVQLENAVREAVTSRAKAQEAADKQALTNVNSISTALKSIVDGNKGVASSFNFAEVQVQNLARGIIAAANAAGSLKAPEPIAVFDQLVKTLYADQDHLISQTQRLALVQRLGGAQMRQTGADMFELLHAIEQGPEYFKKYEDAAAGFYATTEEARQSVEKFKQSFETFSQALSLTKQSIAALISPAVGAFLESMAKSLSEAGGFLHQLVLGIEVVGAAIGQLIKAFYTLTTVVDHALNIEEGRTMKAIIAALVIAVALFASAWAAVPAAIGLVLVALGALAESWGKIKKATLDFFEAFANNPITKTISAWLDALLKFLGLLKDAKTAVTGTPQPAAPTVNTGPPNTEGGNVEGHAQGGHIRGPGTGTSDSILARLSNGEFVMNAKAVQNYGVSFMHALNSMSFPGFAHGGLVTARAPSIGGNSGPTSIVNLTIGDRTFGPMRAPQNVANELQSYSVSRQTSRTGVNPSWCR